LLRRAELDHEDEPAPQNGKNGSGAAAPQEEEAMNLRVYRREACERRKDFKPKLGDVLAGYLNRS
jgi:hypothetical protein